MAIFSKKKKDKPILYIASQWQLMWIKFKKHRLALVGAIIVLLFYLVAIFAEFLTPYNPYFRDMSRVAVSPMPIPKLKTTPISPMLKEIRAPKIIRERRSRPCWSPPNK